MIYFAVAAVILGVLIFSAIYARRALPENITVMAFQEAATGELRPAFVPQTHKTRAEALRKCADLSKRYDGVLAFKICDNFDLSPTGFSKVELFRAGKVPELD
jgi:hypothetical protein